MRIFLSAMTVLATLAFVGCSSSGNNGGGTETARAPSAAPSSTSAPTARSAANSNQIPPKSSTVSILKLDPSEVPLEVRAIEKLGPYELTGDASVMKLLDDLLTAFVAQKRMKLPGSAYRPCYRLVA